MKKDGGTIENWQIHNLSTEQEIIDKVYPGKNAKSMVFTGTVVEDKAGRWESGFRMTSSLIVKIDRENGIIETMNTIYKVINEGNDNVSEGLSKLLGKDSPDLGDNVLDIFY